MFACNAGAHSPTIALRRLGCLITAAALTGAIVACSSDEQNGGADAARDQQSTLSDQAPGTIIGDPEIFHAYPALDSLTERSSTIRYRSTSGIDGSATEVSGLLLVPTGEPPAGGWPIASIGHSTSGSESRCAPSSRIGLMGNLPTVIPFLAEGYVVVMTDYQGLGSAGRHPYLEPKTAGNNVIDAVRAAKEVEPRTSDRWIGYGVSQGAQAVWSANEMSDSYGQGLDLLGTISSSPPTDLTFFVDEMVNGTLTPSQITALPPLLNGLKVSYPELELGDYMHGMLADRADAFMTCIDEKPQLQAELAEQIGPDDYRPSTTEAASRLREWLGDYSVPSVRAPQPMLVAYGDQDELILPGWTRAGVDEACDLGSVVDLQVAQGQGHGILNIGTVTVDWVEGRFQGRPPPNTCTP